MGNTQQTFHHNGLFREKNEDAQALQSFHSFIPIPLRVILRTLTEHSNKYQKVIPICLRPAPGELLKLLINASNNNPDLFFQWIYRLSLFAVHGPYCPLMVVPQGLSQEGKSFLLQHPEEPEIDKAFSIVQPDSFSHLSDILEFVEYNLPFLELLMTYAFRKILLSEFPKAPALPLEERHKEDQLPPYTQAQLNKIKTCPILGYFFINPTNLLKDWMVIALRAIDPTGCCASRLECLYSDNQHGLNFSTMLSRICEYPGRLLIALRVKGSPSIIAAFINHPIRETGGSHYIGNADCMLLRMAPQWRTFKPSGRGNNYFYLNSKNTFAPRGLGLGGQIGCCRLWLDAALDTECYCTNSDSTYEPGDLIDALNDCSTFDKREINIEALEVWACGDSRCRDEYLRSLEREEQIRIERRQVDRAKFAGNAFDQQFLLGNKFANNQRE